MLHQNKNRKQEAHMTKSTVMPMKCPQCGGEISQPFLVCSRCFYRAIIHPIKSIVKTMRVKIHALFRKGRCKP